MTLDSQVAAVLLEDNETVREFARRSPVDLIVDDYGDKEKVGTLPWTPTGQQNLAPSVVNKGDVYLYGANALVIFYASEPNRWSGYTPLGALQDPDVLDAFIGSGETAVTIDFD